MKPEKITIDLTRFGKKEETKEGAQPAGFGAAFQDVPFQAAERSQGEHLYALQDLNSPLWEVYRGAYGNVSEYLAILAGDQEKAPQTFKLRRLEAASKTNYELAFDNLCENLWHQMSFYHATWLALPYLAWMMAKRQQEEDIEWVFRCILAAGSCLATDVCGSRPAEEELWESYQNATAEIRAMTIDFIAEHAGYVREKKPIQRREFAVAATAILGEKRLAFMLFLSGLQSCYAVCPACGNCDEEIEFGYFEPFRRIEAAQVPSEPWDGKQFDDVTLWLFNLFALVRDKEGMERLRYWFGTYTCPVCAKKTPLLSAMEAYYLGE